jgi:hypothetical protein
MGFSTSSGLAESVGASSSSSAFVQNSTLDLR